jgi:5-methyltetrahydrofolate--homocysteine methyltransferase
MSELSTAVATGKRVDAVRLTKELLEAGEPAKRIVDEGLVPGMAVVGERFRCNEIFVPEMLVAARAMKEALKLLEADLAAAGVKPEFTAVIGTVQGDLHDIGKNLVATMWRGANFEVVDLGTNVPPARYVEVVRERKPHVVGISALLTTTMPAMRETVRALREAGVDGAKVVVGGAPITEEFAREIGADGFAADAGAAVDVVKRLLGRAVA